MRRTSDAEPLPQPLHSPSIFRSWAATAAGRPPQLENSIQAAGHMMMVVVTHGMGFSRDAADTIIFRSARRPGADLAAFRSVAAQVVRADPRREIGPSQAVEAHQKRSPANGPISPASLGYLRPK